MKRATHILAIAGAVAVAALAVMAFGAAQADAVGADISSYEGPAPGDVDVVVDPTTTTNPDYIMEAVLPMTHTFGTDAAVTRDYDVGADKATFNISGLAGDSGAIFFDNDSDGIADFQLGFRDTDHSGGPAATVWVNQGGTWTEDTAFRSLTDSDSDGVYEFGANPITSGGRLGTMPDVFDGEIASDYIFIEVEESALDCDFKYGIRDPAGDNYNFDVSTSGWDFDATNDIVTGSTVPTGKGINTVGVNPGTYTEQVTIDKSLTLVSMEGPEETEISLTEKMNIGADDVTVKGFNITRESDINIIYLTGADATVEWNIFEGTIDGYAIRLEGPPANGAKIVNNKFIGTRHAVMDAGASQVGIENNTIIGTGVTGVLITDGTGGTAANVDNVKIKYNLFENIEGEDVFSAVGVYVGAGKTIDGPGIEVNYNHFINNKMGVYALEDTGDLVDKVDATCNWWGDASGPNHTSNPLGSGDNVSDKVEFVPWLNATYPDGECIGGTCKTDIWVDNDYDSSTPGWNIDHFATIQDGVDRVCDGGTVHVAAGAYNASLLIDKPLTLQGAGASQTIINGSSSTKAMKLLIEVYGNLTVDGFTINASEIWGTVYGRDEPSLHDDNPGQWNFTNNTFELGTMYFDHTDADIKICNNTFNTTWEAVGTEECTGAMEIGHNKMNYVDDDNEGNPGLIKISNWPKYWENSSGSFLIPNNATAKQWIHNNTMNCNGAIGITYHSYPSAENWQSWGGPQVVDSAAVFSDVVIENNEISGVGDLNAAAYPGVFNESPYPNAGILLKRNGSGTGFEDTVISSNTITADAGAAEVNQGIHLSGNCTDTTITENSITGFDNAVYLNTTTGEYPSSTAIHYNNFGGNTYGVYTEDPINMTDATCNWWGHPSGPNHTDNPSKDHGIGDNVSDNVDFSPWLNAPYPGGKAIDYWNPTSVDGEADIDEKANADTTVNITTTEEQNVTVQNYVGDPEPGAGSPQGIGPIGKYVDVAVENETAVEWPVNITIYYTQADLDAAGIPETSLTEMLYYDETSGEWEAYNDTGVNTANTDGYEGYVWANAWNGYQLSPKAPSGLMDVWVDDDADPGWYDAAHVRTIKEGIDNVTAGGTVHVWDGTYHEENIFVNKSISIIGNTSVDARNKAVELNTNVSYTDKGFIVQADHVNISGFNITNWGGIYPCGGVLVNHSSRCNISGNVMAGDYDGVKLNASDENVVYNNIILESTYGVWMANGSSHNVIDSNFIRDTQIGILYYTEEPACWNTIVGNNISHNLLWGIAMEYTYQDEIIDNEFWYNGGGSGEMVIAQENGGSNGGAIGLRGANDTYIGGNTMRYNYHGVVMDTCEDNLVESNDIQQTLPGWNPSDPLEGDPPPIGVMIVEGRSYNVIQHNNVSSYPIGIALVGTTHEKVRYNDISANGYGVSLGGTVFSNITGNEIYSNAGYGVRLDSSGYNNLTGNEIYDNTDDGIYFHSSRYNNITGNAIWGNDNRGINLLDSPCNNLTGNYIWNNADEGVYLDYRSSYNNLTENYVADNSHGIYLEGSSGTLLENTTVRDCVASGNAIYDFYATDYTVNTTVTNLTVSSYPTPVDVAYGGTVAVKGVDESEITPYDEHAPLNRYVNVTGSSWVNISIHYTDGDLTYTSEDTLGMYEYTGTSWSEVTTADHYPDDNYLQVNISSFSIYGLFGDITQLNLSLYEGWNMVSVPCNQSLNTAGELAELVNGESEGVCTVITRWDTAKQRYVSYIPGSGEGFALSNGTGYFVYVTADVNVNITGDIVTPDVDLSLEEGFNLVGWPYPYDAEASDIAGGIDNCVKVSKFNASTQTWLPEYVPGLPASNDFAVRMGEGVFVFVNPGPSGWQPR